MPRAKYTQRRPSLSSFEREGIRALYNSAPFKLLRSEPPNFYSIPLMPVSYLDADREIEWCSVAVQDSFDIEVHTRDIGFIKKIIHPYTLNSQVFSPGGGCFIFQYSKRWPPFPPAFAEYSYEALLNGYYCKLGWVLLSSSSSCPVKNKCPFYKPLEGKGSSCQYYSGSPPGAKAIAYSSMYNVYPVVRRLFFSHESGDPVFAVGLEEKPLVIVRFLEDAEVRYYIDTIEFSPRNIIMYRKPILYLRKGIGMRLRGIHALEFEFIPESLRKFVHNLLRQDITLTRWILLKFELFREKSGEIRERRGFKAFDKMLEQIVEKAVNEDLSSLQSTQLWRKLQNPDVSDEEFLQFAEVLLLHGLAHTLKHALETYMGCNPEDLQYFLEHPRNPSLKPQSERLRFVIFENAVGGLGYIKTLAQSIKMDHQEYRRFHRHLRSILDAYERHSQFIMNRRKVMTANLSSFRSHHSHLVDVINNVYRIAEKMDVYPHVNSLREILANEVVSDEDRTRLDDILSYTPLCWDGCQLCVILEHGCSFITYDQPFLISLRLTIRGLKEMVNGLEDPKLLLHFIKGVKDIFYGFLNTARSHIYITTPWISKNIVKDLLGKAGTGVTIKLLVSDDTNNDANKESLDYLRQTIHEHHQLEVRLCSLSEIFIHAKGVMVDDCMLLEGSFNLTNRGLEENVENITISFSPHDALDFARGFNQQWNSGKTLT